jgi:hypothetical protein
MQVSWDQQHQELESSVLCGLSAFVSVPASFVCACHPIEACGVSKMLVTRSVEMLNSWSLDRDTGLLWLHSPPIPVLAV